LNDLKNDKSFIDSPNNVAELFKDKQWRMINTFI
jgi:hypothetical protein